MRVDTEGEQQNPTAGPPRWVKMFTLVALVVVAVFVIALASGHRGTGRHVRSLDTGESSHPPPTGREEHRP